MKAFYSFLCLFGACILLAIGLFIVPIASSYAAVPQLINYQGKLTKASGAPLDTTIQMVFTIYADSNGITSKWSESQSSVKVEKGVFNVLLGSVDSIPYSVFDGSIRYLGVKVGGDPEITPRKKMVSMGYAYKSFEADTADYARAGAGGGADNDWAYRVTDGADTTLMTGGAWGISRSGNTLYGNADSTHVNLGIGCSTGSSGQNFKYCTVGGGVSNRASGAVSTIGGGEVNAAIAPYATVGGGQSNTASSEHATVGGGQSNTASWFWATVAGGYSNTASNNSATVGGGIGNTAGYVDATVGGGCENTASGGAATIGGGYSNQANDWFATVGGGSYNMASDTAATVGGGYLNAARGFYSVIPGGYADTIASCFSFVAGSQVRLNPTADYTFAFGRNFTTSASHAVIFHDGSTPIKVGIGTTSPTQALDVAGTAQMTGFRMPTGVSNGYVLTSDASGVGTWQATSGEKDWAFRITDTADTTLATRGAWGIARYGNTLYGNADSTHVNFGVACTSGASEQNYKYCTVGGGWSNVASNTIATVGGGGGNRASASTATIGGGGGNTASGYASTVAGGYLNTASYNYTTVGGGRYNFASAYNATVGGGESDTASAQNATVGGGSSNLASSVYATVSGGDHNTASGQYYATVGGGTENMASGPATTVGGGSQNVANNAGAAIAGGVLNTASGSYATVGSGESNTASGSHATIPGGYADTAASDYSFAAGDRVRITSAGSYTFAFGSNFTTSTSHAVIFNDASAPIKVGVGITSPTANMHLHASDIAVLRLTNSATGTADNNGIQISPPTNNSLDAIVWNRSNGFLSLGTNNLHRVRITSDGKVGIGTTTPQGALDVSSTTGAFIVPRMSTGQRDGLTAVNGMIIYNTSTNQFNFYENGAWVTK